MPVIYWVGQAGELKQTVKINSVELDRFTLAKAYLAFEFADESKQALSTTQMEDRGEDGTEITFDIPPDFFTKARKGPCKIQMVILDSDNNPAVAFPIYEGAQVHDMIMSPGELTA